MGEGHWRVDTLGVAQNSPLWAFGTQQPCSGPQARGHLPELKHSALKPVWDLWPGRQRPVCLHLTHPLPEPRSPRRWSGRKEVDVMSEPGLGSTSSTSVP